MELHAGFNQTLTRLQVVLLGDCRVGKTSLLKRFCEDKFKEIYTPTIGIDFNTKVVRVKEKFIKIQIW